jgi:hypothetical protein
MEYVCWDGELVWCPLQEGPENRLDDQRTHERWPPVSQRPPTCLLGPVPPGYIAPQRPTVSQHPTMAEGKKAAPSIKTGITRPGRSTAPTTIDKKTDQQKEEVKMKRNLKSKKPRQNPETERKNQWSLLRKRKSDSEAPFNSLFYVISRKRSKTLIMATFSAGDPSIHRKII